MGDRTPSLPKPWASFLCLLGAGVVVLGGILPYGSGCDWCSVLAPADTPFQIWIVLAAQVLGIATIAIIFGLRLARRKHSRYDAGFVTATGVMAVLEFVPFGIHPEFLRTQTFGLGGVVGMIGGMLILFAGVLAARQSGAD